MSPDPAERRIREIAAFDNTALADDIRELLDDYDHRGQEIERLTAIITRYETGAQQIIHKLNQGVNR